MQEAIELIERFSLNYVIEGNDVPLTMVVTTQEPAANAPMHVGQEISLGFVAEAQAANA